MKVIFILFCFISFVFSFSFPLSWSANISGSAIFEFETAMFEGMVYVNHENKTSYTASSGQYVTGFQNPSFLTEVNICGETSSWWTEYQNGTCELGCCGGSHKTLLNNFLIMGNRDGGSDGCDCATYPILVFSLAKEVGECSRNGMNGTLHQFSESNSDGSATISVCMNNNIPIFYHESVTQYPSYIGIIVDLTFNTFQEGVTDPSIFTPPSQCDCNIY